MLMRTKAILMAAAGLGLSVVAWLDAQSILSGAKPAATIPVLTGPPRQKLATPIREALFTRQLPTEQRATLRSSALDSLAREPLDATAIWIWGGTDPASGESASFLLAERITRRELGVQMELLRARATRKDLAGAFQHLDRALTVFPDANATLLPGVALGLDAPELRAILVPYAERPWFPALIRQAAEKAPDPLGATALLTEAQVSVQGLTPGTLPRLLNALIKAGEGFEAGQLAVRMKAISEAGLEQFGLSEQTLGTEGRPLTWQLTNNEAASVKPEGNAAVTFAVEPGRSATLLDRVTVYRSGTFLLRSTLSGSDARIIATWELRCLGPDGERLTWSQRLPVNPALQRINVQTRIPDDCAAQRWLFKASASDLQVLATGQLQDIDLELSAND